MPTCDECITSSGIANKLNSDPKRIKGKPPIGNDYLVTKGWVDEHKAEKNGSANQYFKVRRTIGETYSAQVSQVPRYIHRYVDPTYGDDNNNGTSSSPFRTLKKAVESGAYRAYMNITIKGNAPVIVDGNINGLFQTIYIIRENTEDIIFKYYQNSTYNFLFSFANINEIVFNKCIIKTDEATYDTSKAASGYLSIINHDNIPDYRIILYRSKIILPDRSGVYLLGMSSAKGSISVSLYSTEVNSIGTNSYMADVYNGSNIGMYNNVTFTGAKTSLKDVLSGVKYDPASGAPLNVVTNVELLPRRKWQDVTSQRAIGATYVNNTQRDIEVSFSAQVDDTSEADHSLILWVYENGAWLNVSEIENLNSDGDARMSNINATIPAGKAYKIAYPGSHLSAIHWKELR